MLSVSLSLLYLLLYLNFQIRYHLQFPPLWCLGFYYISMEANITRLRSGRQPISQPVYGNITDICNLGEYVHGWVYTINFIQGQRVQTLKCEMF